jgi:hypothetical protein
MLQDLHADADRQAAAPPLAARPLPELPDAHVDGALLMRAVQAATTSLHARAPEVVLTDKPASDVAIQRRLDAFREAVTPTYRTPQGDVTVPMPFRTAWNAAIAREDGAAPGILVRQQSRVDANRPAVMQAAASVGIGPSAVLLVQQGRGSPQDVRRLTQALIDRGRLPDTVVSNDEPPRLSVDLSSRVRAMMADHGLGLDGPGYTRQAMPAPAGSVRVAAGSMKVGDVVTLRSGECGVIYDRREATDDEKAALARTTGLARGPVTAWEVDGAWQPHWAGPTLDLVGGGGQRETWLHDEATGKWASKDTGGKWRSSDGPRGDVLEGVFRPLHRETLQGE